jgi:hypothetical protein
MFTIDTNTIIYYAAGDKKVVAFFYEHRANVFLSAKHCHH